MIIDGKQIAAELSADLQKEFAALPKKARLGVLLMSADFATQKFIAIKRTTAEKLGVELVQEVIPDDATTEDVLNILSSFCTDCDGIIVQLPLGKPVDTERIIAALPPNKDVDGIAPGSAVLSPVVEAMREVLDRSGVSVQGKKAVVVGQGKLVGIPATAWLRAAGAEVAAVTEESGDLKEALKHAEVVVLGAGHPGLVKPSMLRQGVVLLDMGTSEAGGKLAGDADPACVEVSSVFTPVPGGIGPIAVVMIFKNLLRLRKGF